MREIAITTEDNPYDPLDDFANWYNYDITNGYNTTSRLSSITNTSKFLSDDLNKEEIERGIDILVKDGFVIGKNGEIYHFKKVSREY